MTFFSPVDTMSFFILMTLCVIIDRPKPFLCIEALICKDTDDNSLQDSGLHPFGRDHYFFLWGFRDSSSKVSKITVL